MLIYDTKQSRTTNDRSSKMSFEPSTTGTATSTDLEVTDTTTSTDLVVTDDRSSMDLMVDQIDLGVLLDIRPLSFLDAYGPQFDLVLISETMIVCGLPLPVGDAFAFRCIYCGSHWMTSGEFVEPEDVFAVLVAAADHYLACTATPWERFTAIVGRLAGKIGA
jgi:hypothetical protein